MVRGSATNPKHFTIICKYRKIGDYFWIVDSEDNYVKGRQSQKQKYSQIGAEKIIETRPKAALIDNFTWNKFRDNKTKECS